MILQSKQKCWRLTITFLLLASFAACGVSSGEAVPLILNTQSKNDLLRIKNYLEGIKTLKGGFLQVSSNGDLASGKIFLSKPGRARFEYNPPSPILLIADGTFLVFIDRDLEQTTHVFLNSTPLRMLVSENIDFKEDVTVTKIARGPGTLNITFKDSEEPEKGSISLLFSDKPLRLRKWSVIDSQTIETTVTLTNIQTGIELDPNLFVVSVEQFPWMKIEDDTLR